MGRRVRDDSALRSGRACEGGREVAGNVADTSAYPADHMLRSSRHTRQGFVTLRRLVLSATHGRMGTGVADPEQ